MRITRNRPCVVACNGYGSYAERLAHRRAAFARPVERNVGRHLKGITDRARKETDARRDDDPTANDTSDRSLGLAGR